MDSTINEITTFATTALNEFYKKNPDSCPDISCRLTKMFDVVDENYPYSK